jgi:Na+-driven multidrug efflux pump
LGALSLKTVLGYALIFGHLGLPAVGMLGAAIATCCARLLECAVMLTLTYRWQLPAAARPREMFVIDRALAGRFAATSFPVVVNEILWSLGITTYAAIYARISTESVAAVNIATTIESVALVPFMGLGNACAIILGNCIGAGETGNAALYARRFLQLAIVGALLVGTLIFASSGLMLDLYRISADTHQYAQRVLVIIALALWMKAANMVMIVGILRSGGDTRFSLIADVGPLWLIGVPLALVGAFIFHLPVYWVVVLVLADEGTKFVLAMWRVLSGRWINNVIHAV